MYAIPVLPDSLDLISELNHGVRPVFEASPTYFVFEPTNGKSMIISFEEFAEKIKTRTIIEISLFH